MSLKRQIQKNSIQLHGKAIKTAHRSYAEGLEVGLKEGRLQGLRETYDEIQKVRSEVHRAMDLFFNKLQSLREVPDIGEKRFKAILEYFGYDAEEISRKEP